MNLSNGVDIVKVSDFRKHPVSSTFINKLFTKRELEYCLGKNDPYPHLAARFAAKEAVCKALGNLGIIVPLNTIKIVKNKDQSVSAEVNNVSCKISLSISHTKSIAIAFCTVWKCNMRDVKKS